jgi:hypothetical protein
MKEAFPMAHRKILIGFTLSAAMGLTAAYAQNKPAAPAAAAPSGAGGAGAAAPAKPTCKLHGKACCDPAIEAHLPKEAVYKACGESEETYLGQEAQRETCKYFFKVKDAPEAETFVQVYAPQQKEVLQAPNDPFFSWKKIGKAYITDKAKSPKAAPMAATATGLYLPGKGYSVSVNASTKVCTKTEAAKLGPAMK